MPTALAAGISPEIGHHHHIAGAYLLRYAQEAMWREDNRRVSNGAQVDRLTKLALTTKASVGFHGLLATTRRRELRAT